MVEISGSVVIVQALSFLITLWIIKRLAWVPIQNQLTSRAVEIRTDYEKAEAARVHMEELVREYEAKIAANRAEAQVQISAALHRAEEQAVRIVAAAREEAQATTERAREEVTREREKVVSELRAQVAHLSVAVASKIIGANLDETRHHELVDDYIARLGTLS
jgi:F-type H+-transporting ATPase subunit b